MTSSPKRICVLGSTGSVGATTLQVVGDHPDRFEIVGLSAHTSIKDLEAQVQLTQPEAACLSGEPETPTSTGKIRWLTGPQGLIDLIGACRPDLVVVAIVGAAGLGPTLRALELGVPVALANKEVLVTAGDLVMETARRSGARILPIDSEHNAIFQCLDGRPDDPVRRILITGSGGPFRGWTRVQLAEATIEQALNHPTWSMGKKITIDSATLMNKGLEAIEGHHLFAQPIDKFEVVIHPQSIVHSFVEFIDGSTLAQLGVTDMYFPVAHALAYPERLKNERFESLNLAQIGSLGFENYSPEVFPCLGYAYEAARLGGTYPAALNAANEDAVARFLSGELPFLGIADAIADALGAHKSSDSPDLDSIRAADAWARERVGSFAASRAAR